MLEQEIGGAVESDRRLPGAWTALDDQCPIQRRSDDPVLLRLDRGHDLAHRPGSGPVDLGEQRVGDAGRCFGVGQVGVVDLDELIALEHELAPQLDPHRMQRGGSVERLGRTSSPVDDQGVLVLVGDVLATDVEGVVVLVVETREAGGLCAGVTQALHAAGQVRRERLSVRVVLVGLRRREQGLDVRDRRVERCTRRDDVGLFGLVFRVSFLHHSPQVVASPAVWAA